MRSATLVLSFAMFSVQGCTVIKSREPLYDRTKESTFNKGFVGTWSNQDMRWTIARGEPDGAMITLESLGVETPEKPVTAPADLVLIGSWRYVFFRIPDGESDLSLQSTAHTLPGYRMRRVWSDLKLSYVSADALARRLESGSAPFAHSVEPGIRRTTMDGTVENEPKFVTIDASAREIRSYLQRHENDPGLFGTVTLQREQ